MSYSFARAMRLATFATRTKQLARATRIIQSILSRSKAVPETRAPATPPDRGTKRLGKSNAAPPQALAGSGLNPLARFAGGKPFASAASVKASAAPVGASFVEHRFACSAGARTYKLYVPASAGGAPRGLVLMLHGCTQNPDDFAAGTGMNIVAEQHGLLVAYPCQQRAANAGGCWNWFNPGDQKRAQGEPAILAGITRELAAQYGLARHQIYVAGLSAGGAMAMVMGETYPDLFASVGVHSGLACGLARDMVSAFAAMKGGGSASIRQTGDAEGVIARVRTIIFHGTADRTVHPVNAEKIATAASLEAGPGQRLRAEHRRDNGRATSVSRLQSADGGKIAELWMVEGAGHAWSGGNPSGSFTDASGPDASAEMVRFFLSSGQPDGA